MKNSQILKKGGKNMSKNYGKFVESEIVMSLNNRHVHEIPKNLKYALYQLYGPLEEDEIIKSEQIDGWMKPDIWVEYKGDRKYISVKSGQATEVHGELMSTFVPFLKEIGVPEEFCNFVLAYCYADGTTDGTGPGPMNFYDIKRHFYEQTAKFNEYMLNHPEIVEKVIDRVLFDGCHEENIKADCLYFGDANYGNIVSKKQIMKHLQFKKYTFMDNPHIGPLQFRAHIRGQSKNPEHEYKRHTIDLWWANLGPEMQRIASRYNFK